MKTLDEYFETHEALKLLKENLETNLEVMTKLKKEERESLMRLNLVVIRQCLQDCGVE
jgi:hypothetical protein